MILTIAFGISAWCATFSALSSLSGDPLHGRGTNLYHPQVDPTPASIREANASPPSNLTLRDARALYRAAPQNMRVMTSRNWLPVVLSLGGVNQSRMAITRSTTADFFKLFRVPFLYGHGWSDAEGDAGQRVVVLSKKTNQQLFGGRNSVGSVIEIATKPFVIVGVIDQWEMIPRFYDLSDGAFASNEELFIPFDTWLSLPQDYGYGPMVCWSNQEADMDHNPESDTCTWVQLWVELQGAGFEGYKSFLHNYSIDQRNLGRYTRPPNVRLPNALTWIKTNRAIPDSVRVQYWVANSLLLVCLMSTAVLMVVKFRGAYKEFGLRRALGASSQAIFKQLIIEAGLIGLIGGIFGLIFSFFIMTILQRAPDGYASYITIHPSDLAISLFLSIATTVLAGVIPALRVSLNSPYRQLVDG